MKKKKKRRVSRILLLVLTVGICLIGWNYLKPMLVVNAETTYESYTVETGSIVNTMSFSASLALSSSETLTSSEDTTVRKIFVEVAQKVSKDGKLMQLANGEIIRAGIDGTVNDISVSVGDKVAENTTLAQVCNLTDMKVIIQVDEYDIDKISVGQNCTVTILSLDRSFDTQISHISRVSSSSRAVAYYTVTAQATVPEDILPGMQASVSIPSAEATDVTVLDMSALSFDDEKKPYVLKKSADGSYEKITIEAGLNDGLKVEIKNGLEVGDVVYIESGVEAVKQMFSFISLYKAVAGETVVINDMSRMDRFLSGDMPFEGGEIDFSNMPEGFNIEGMGQMPGMSASDGEVPADGEVPSATAAPSDGSDLQAGDGNVPDMSNMPADAQGDMPFGQFDGEGGNVPPDMSGMGSEGERPDFTADGSGESIQPDGRTFQSPPTSMNEGKDNLEDGGETNE